MRFPIRYEDEKVGVYRPDFFVEKKVILELKAVQFVPRYFELQLVRYLRLTGCEVGLLVNFGKGSVEVTRRVAGRVNNAS